MILLPLLCVSYLLGSIPAGFVIGKLKGIDVRSQGSGNVGATNVNRVVGKLPGLVVLVVDVWKGWFPASVLGSLAAAHGASSPATARILLGLAAVAGHIWNPFLNFKGGKGVAAALGVLLGLNPLLAAAAVGVWIAAAAATRYVSVASVSAAVSAPFIMLLIGSPTAWILGGIAVALAITARHRSNFLRLLHGEEHRLGR